MPVKLLVSVGERSGDLRAGALISELKKLVPGMTMKGLGGDSLHSQGLRSEYDIQKLSVVGFTEVVRHLQFFMGVMSRMETLLDHWRPDRVLLVDYPGFNLRLAGRAAKRGIPVTYYISPQVWAWGGGRVRQIKKTVDQMLVLFPFEKEFYENRGIDSEFVGHPLVDEVAPSLSHEAFTSQMGLEFGQRIIGLFPGSRMQEVRSHLPIMLEALSMVQDVAPIVGLAPGIDDSSLRDSGIRTTRAIYDLLAFSSLAVVASGTITLEAALLRTPIIVVYKTTGLSAFIARRLIKVPFVAMPNIVAGKLIVPELLQDRFRSDILTQEIGTLIGDKVRMGRMKDDLTSVAGSLGPHGASGMAARAVASRLP